MTDREKNEMINVSDLDGLGDKEDGARTLEHYKSVPKRKISEHPDPKILSQLKK